MVNIHSNGSKWAGEAPDAIDKLCEVLGEYALDRSWERYGAGVFITAPDPDSPVHNGAHHFFGNFAKLSHVFNIDTDEPEVIERLTRAIRANQQTAEYLAQDEPLKDKNKCALCDKVWLLAKSLGLTAYASNGEKLLKGNGGNVVLWDMSEGLLNQFIAVHGA